MNTPQEQTAPPRKRLFVALMGLTCVMLVCMFFLAWWIPSRGLANIHPELPRLVGLAVLILSGIAVLGTGLLVLTTALGTDILFTRFMRLVVIKFLLPLIEFVGRLLGLDRDRIRQSFIAMNNSLVLSQRCKLSPEKVMILLPHCIQLAECEIKVTGSIAKCTLCGRCDIREFVKIGEHYSIDISVATGGTLARKVIVEKRPHLVLAVACERDLTAGIKDCYPLPVIGILNQRPLGPCLNTLVDLQAIEHALMQVLDPASVRPAAPLQPETQL